MAFYDDKLSHGTIRCDGCQILVPVESNQCSVCHAYRQTLNRMFLRFEDSTRDTCTELNRVNPQSHTNYRYLSSLEKDKRMKVLHQQSRVAQQQINRLKKKLKNVIEQRSNFVEEELHNDLSQIIKDNDDSVKKTFPLEDSFQRVFWESQKRASSLKNAKSMKWDPLMIRWCLYLRHLSSSAYQMLRESGVICLPSQRTLRDYTYHIQSSIGFSEEVDKYLMDLAKISLCPEREKYVVLLMDEMHIKEDLVYDKHSGIYTNACTRCEGITFLSL